MSILDLFSWRKKIDEFDVRELFITLKQTAESYLLSPAKTDKQILIEAKQAHLTAFDIFPIMGIDRHGYNIYLYETLFYRQDYNGETILPEMIQGNVIPAEIVSAMYSNQRLQAVKDEEIQRLGLNFWSEFVEHKKNEKKIPGRKIIKQLDNIRYDCFGFFPKTLSFDECYIASIKYLNAQTPYVMAEIFANPEQNQKSIYVYLPFEEIICFLKIANNPTVSSMVRSMLFENLKNNGQYTDEIEIRDCYRTYLYCKGIHLEVTQCNFNVSPFEEIGNNFYALNGFNIPDE